MDTARGGLVGQEGRRKNGAARDMARKTVEKDAEAKLLRDLGSRIVALREARGMSQARLAKRLGIDRSRLSKWERGQHQPLLKHLHALAEILGVSLAELLTGESVEQRPLIEAGVRRALAGMVVTLNRLLEPRS
jgi:transcriptional regulator with XRE-family HTH domain